MFGLALLAGLHARPRRLVERVVVDTAGVEDHARGELLASAGAGLRVGWLATADRKQGKCPHYGDDLGCVTQGIALLLSWYAVERGTHDGTP